MLRKVNVIISEKYSVIIQKTTRKSMNMWNLYSSPSKATMNNKEATQNRMKKIGCNGLGGTDPNLGSIISFWVHFISNFVNWFYVSKVVWLLFDCFQKIKLLVHLSQIVQTVFILLLKWTDVLLPIVDSLCAQSGFWVGVFELQMDLCFSGSWPWWPDQYPSVVYFLIQKFRNRIVTV